MDASRVWLLLRPELLVLGAALLVVLVDLVLPRGNRRWLGWFSALLALALVGVVLRQWSVARIPVPLWGGVAIADRLGLAFKAIFLLAVAVVSIGSADHAAARFRHVGEYYGLLFFSALGMMLMASAGDLLTLYLGVELTTLSLSVLVAFAKDQPRSSEAGLKYIILGAVASATYIYGTSLIYGSAGTTQFSLLTAGLARDGVTAGFAVGAVMVIAAFAFKVAAVPFHMWAPDVYQGAPTPVTAFLSTASKAAGFAALIRVLYWPMQAASGGWLVMVMVLAALSMVVGNLLAIPQRNIKRMLAYSGIAQAGYALVGVASLQPLGYSPRAVLALVFFLCQYLFTYVGAFLVVSVVGASGGDDSIESFHGLSRRNPVLALALLVLLLSLGGIPPLSGFWGKLFLFWAAASAGQYALVLIGVLASVVSLYYYLMVARAMYIEPAEERPVVRSRNATAVAVLICVTLVIGLAYPAPILHLASQAAISFPGAGLP